MRILVASASKHGSTTEIARAIGTALLLRMVEADVRPVESVVTLDRYDAVVLGSGIYMGHWLEPAKRFIEHNTAELLERPVWLFSSGPLGDPPKPVEEPVDAAGLIAAIHARGHRVFAGSLDKHELGITERAMVAAVRAPEGDFRPWAEIDAWAEEIVTALALPV
jgi:menaquinone-dependent protoporphyrinogen oxidase